jgi:hypothetical protein
VREAHRLEESSSASEEAKNLRDFLGTKVLPWCDRCRRLLEDPSVISAKAFGETLSHDRTDQLARYEVSLDRKFERTLRCC